MIPALAVGSIAALEVIATSVMVNMPPGGFAGSLTFGMGNAPLATKLAAAILIVAELNREPASDVL